MRVILVALALAGGLVPSTISAEAVVHTAQMSRDVTDAVRKQRAERRACPHPNRSIEETRR